MTAALSSLGQIEIAAIKETTGRIFFLLGAGLLIKIPTDWPQQGGPILLEAGGTDKKRSICFLAPLSAPCVCQCVLCYLHQLLVRVVEVPTHFL